MVDISYDPSPAPVDPSDLGRYTYDELQRIRDAINELMYISPSMLDISRGIIPGHKGVNKFGTNVDIPDGTEEIVWSASHAYTFSTTADITHIVSSSASDTQSIEVRGLDADWNEVIQEKTLTGTTSVALDTPLIRVIRMKVMTPPINVGEIQCGVGPTTTSFAAANLRATIEIDTGQTLMAIWTCPAGKTAYVTGYYASIIGDAGPPSRAPAYVVFRIYAIDRENNTARQLKHAIGGVLAGTSVIDHRFEPYPSITEKTDIYITAEPDGDSASVGAGFDIILVDNNV